MAALEGEQGEPPRAVAAAPLFNDFTAKMVNLRDVARPSNFDGAESAWSGWRVKFESVMGLLGLSTWMELAARHPRQIRTREQAAGVRERGLLLHAILLQVCAGKALGIVRLVPEQNGL